MNKGSIQSILMNSKVALLLLCFSLMVVFGFNTKVRTKFVFEKTPQGIVLYENECPVYFYRKEQKTPDGKMFFNNYLHPLFSLGGDTLTEEFPSDHPYHRGIFWAWHQVYLNNQSIGDGWVMENISQDVVDVKTKVDKNSAQLSLNVIWKSSLFQDGKPFVQEHTTILVHQLKNEVRAIDFEIGLKALVPGVSIGGSNDEKGYGGFCARIKHTKALTFTSEKGQVMSGINQIKAGPWVDFSFPNGKQGETDGIMILCHPGTPNYPAPWILRSYEASMQNIVFPGKERVEILMDKPTVLRYRLIIHKGSSQHLDMVKMQSDYEKISSEDFSN
jgi:hypothetical protein